jgi:hypothetical protein
MQTIFMSAPGKTNSIENSLGLKKMAKKRENPDEDAPAGAEWAVLCKRRVQMLYKFKSRVTGELIMLEVNGRQVLEILGKDPARPGIIEAADAPAAIQTLEAAVAKEETDRKAAVEEAAARGEPEPRFEGISLRQRVVPLIDMLRRSEKAGKEIVWGV